MIDDDDLDLMGLDTDDFGDDLGGGDLEGDDMAAAMADDPELAAPPPSPLVDTPPRPVAKSMGSANGKREEGKFEAVYDIPVKVSAVLGKSSMQVSQLLKLGRGAVVELDRKVGEAIDVYVNNRLVARGEVVVIEDKLGISLTEIIRMEM